MATIFLNTCYWEHADDSTLIFRGGGTDYLVYDKNDEFGGAGYTDRFNYIKKQRQDSSEQT